MKRFISQLVVIASVIFIAASCQQAPFITMTGPRSYTFTREGGTQSFSFACNREWSVSSTESWITVSPSKGSATDGETKVTITCSPNTTYDARSATITVKTEDLSESITITQDTGIGLIVSPKTFDLTNAEQTIEIEVQKNVQYTVAIDNTCADWIKQGGTKALTTDKITFTIAANKTYDNREGKITFKQLDGNLSETVVVRQNQTNGIFITTPTYDLSNAEHTLSVEVKANVEFEVTSQADWIKYVETKALTPSTVTLTIEANESYDNRIGTVLVKQTNGDLSGTITIKQHQTDGLFVTPDSFDLSNEEHTIELEIQKNVDFTVVIPEDAKDWIYQPTKGNTKALVGDRVILVVSANSTYDDREASVTIKQINGSLAETVKIKQAYGEGLIVDTKTFELDREAASVEVDVMSNVEYEVETEATWVHYVQTKALVKSTVELSIDENTGYTTREATVNIKQKNGNLVQTVKVIQTPFGHVTFENYDYKTIKYGDREWFAENLRAKFGYEEGERINENGDRFWPSVGSPWAELNGELVYAMDDICYKLLKQDKPVCPEGWHISTTDDWQALFSLSTSSASAPFVKKSLGGTDDFCFGGNYGRWHTASFWLEKMLCSLFEDNAVLSSSDGAFIESRSANQRHFPAENYRHIRCVRGPIAPIIQTLPVIKLTTNSAEVRFEVLNNPEAKLFPYMNDSPNSTITKVVFKYGTSKDNLSSSIESSDLKSVASLNSLTPGTTYYYQPMVEYEGGNSAVSGEIMSFKTYYSTLDYQGVTYYTTLLGNVEFMSQNLRSVEFNDGTPIPLISPLDDWIAADGPGQCIAYNNEEYLEPLGRLYNGYAVQTGKICPEGWRLPKNSEIINENNGNCYGESMNTGLLFLPDMKYWANPVLCNNDLSLSLLPSGGRYGDSYFASQFEGGFYGEHWKVYLWSQDDSNSNTLNAIEGTLQMGMEGYVQPYKLYDSSKNRGGYAIRCVRDK